MDRSSASNKTENEWSEEHDRLPLKQRLKMLLATKQHSDLGHAKAPEEIKPVSILPVDIIVKTEHEDCMSQIQSLTPDESCSGRPRECAVHMIEPNTSDCSNQIVVAELNGPIARVEGVSAGSFTGISLLSSSVNCQNGSCSAEVQALNIKTETPDDTLDNLDHVGLIERRRILLSRKSMESTKSISEDNVSGLLIAGMVCVNNDIIGNEENISIGKEFSIEGHNFDYVPERSGTTTGSSSASSHCLPSVNQSGGTQSTRSGNVMNIHGNDRILCYNRTSTQTGGGKDVLSAKENAILNSALTSSVKVKAEPLDNNELDKNVLCNSLITNIFPVKSEPTVTVASFGDDKDHMLLRARMKLLTSREIQNADICAEGSTIILSGTNTNFRPISSKSATPVKIKCSRKRKKTATDSVETALEEDAPGLLQVLVDKGVLVDEMKLYGQTEIDEALDESLIEDSFSELEAVMSKLFLERHSMLKFAPLRSTKGDKIRYCLACLVSLVEQARYLQFRKWPVEWGWCRDLQSFIFVFKRHNRIVLERPEYGYATYFFELIDSANIDWQIKRLITTMKLTSCSRSTLLENKALKVGEDLTEGEAGVLAQYGWVPNSGLGTMLNYCDRVVHDRKNEKDTSEWRSKIGKLLMDGYNGGTIISTDIPKKVAENPQIKLEI